MPALYTRPNMRLRGYDYTSLDACFVTINLDVRQLRFGSMSVGELLLHEAGQMVDKVWHALPDRFPTIVLDAFVAIPDHIHGPLFMNDGIENSGSPHLSEVIRVFKSTTTTHYIAEVKTGRWPRFEKHLW